MSVLVNEGRAAIAAAIASRPLHLAWGEGDASWTEPAPAPSTGATTVLNEVGRRVVTRTAFCVPDENGDIQTTTGRYREVATPTPHLYLFTKFDFADAPNATIRTLGVFMDTQVVSGLPEGQKYFLPSQLQNDGLLLVLENLERFIPRSPASRETFELVVTF